MTEIGRNTDVQLHHSDVVQRLANKLCELGMEFAVFGGYPRDLHHGQAPKDLDICIYNLGAVRKDAFDALDAYLEAEDLISSDGADYDYEEEVGRFDEVFKLTCNVDLIMMNLNYTTKQQVADSFDFNISQYTLDLATDTLSFMGQDEGTLKRGPNRPHVSPDRFAHIKGRAEQLGWDVSQIDNAETGR